MDGRTGYSDARGLLASKLRQAYARRGGMANVGHMAYADAEYGGLLTKEERIQKMREGRKKAATDRKQLKQTLLNEYNFVRNVKLKNFPPLSSVKHEALINTYLKMVNEGRKGRKLIKARRPAGARRPNEYSNCLKEYGQLRKNFNLPPNATRLKRIYDKAMPLGSRCQASKILKAENLLKSYLFKRRYRKKKAKKGAGAMGGANAGILYDVYDKGGYIDDYDYLE